MNFQGLTDKEASIKLTEFGKNILPSEKSKPWFLILFECAKAPMSLLLVACSTIYLLLGDVREGVLLFAGALFTAALDFFQTYKTQKALSALKSLTSPRALVVRDGQQRRISSQELVPGDLILLSEGDRIPADAKLIFSSALSVDESLLTGESLPVHKLVSTSSSLVFSGTLVVAGKAEAIVTETGARSQIGKIGLSLSTDNDKETHLQVSLKSLIKNIFLLSLLFLVLVVLLSGFMQKNWLKATLLGLSTSISMIPEELPVVLTVFLAMGAWKIAQHRVLTRRVASLEHLGAVSSLCVDKTGTLTENAMEIKKLSRNRVSFDLSPDPLPENFHALIEFAVLSSHRDPFDPMEKAIHHTLEKYLKNTDHQHLDWNLIREYPLTDQLRAMACVWKAPSSSKFIVAAKGAPEDIFDLCHFDSNQTQALLAEVETLAREGLRVLAVAKSQFESSSHLPNETHDFEFEYLGLLGLEDPLRPSVPMALKTCWKAGIKVFVLTGDYPSTAKKIALQAGFPVQTQAFTGDEMARLPNDKLQEILSSDAIFSRMSHKDKVSLVETLQKKGEVVAMTGDGVNDAPSLRKADIGIAMGKRGTDVAREAADIILLDDDFSEIVTAISLGRKIYQQIRTAMTYTFSLHIPIGALTLLPILLRIPPILEPLHLVFLELIIDPSCTVALGFITTKHDLMSEPPRKRDSPFFDRCFFRPILLRGVLALGLVTSLPMALLVLKLEESTLRTYSFLTLFGTILGLLFGALPKKLENASQNSVWITVYGVALVLLGSVFKSKLLLETFHFQSVPLLYGLLALIFGLIPCALTRLLANK